VKGHVHRMSKESSKLYIGIGHDNWNLVLHMIFGVSKSVRQSKHEDAFEITEEDFTRKYPSELGQPTEKGKDSTYIFYDFAPRVFH